MELVVGSKVRLNRDMMREHIGSVGFVYESYDRHDGTLGASIIFQNGSYDGFSPEERDLFLEYIGEDPRFSMYEFEHVGQVECDYRKGYWDFNG